MTRKQEQATAIPDVPSPQGNQLLQGLRDLDHRPVGQRRGAPRPQGDSPEVRQHGLGIVPAGQNEQTIPLSNVSDVTVSTSCSFGSMASVKGHIDEELSYTEDKAGNFIAAGISVNASTRNVNAIIGAINGARA